MSKSNAKKLGKEWNSHAWAWPRKQVKKKNIALENLDEYCLHSSLHGISYLGAKNISLLEKVWWLILFLASVFFCLYLISAAWIKWQQNPVLLSFEKEQIPVWDIPFPAVTICPINKVKQTVYNYTEIFPNRDSLPPDDYKKFWDISLVCSFVDQYNIKLNSSIDVSDKMATRNILQVAPDIFSTIFYAGWQKNGHSDNLFGNHLSKEGLCFTFNSLNHDEMYTTEMDADMRDINQQLYHANWDMEKGYTVQSNLDDYPKRTANSGFGSGLTLYLFQDISEIDNICGLSISGYKVILHNPVEIVQGDEQYFHLDLNKKATLMVKPELITTSTSVRHLNARVRKCYLSKEKSLKFFKVYTENNCRMECFANITEYYCDCIPFYLPHGNESLICGYGKLICLMTIKEKILHFEVLKKASKISKTYNEDMNTKAYEIYSNCDCMPACNSLQYTAEVSHTSMRLHNSLLNSGLVGNVPEKLVTGVSNNTIKMSSVDIFFKESQFLGLQRTELHNQTDFIANCGGLLGLFMGFSVLSIVEIIYFFTLRLWCKIRQRNQC